MRQVAIIGGGAAGLCCAVALKQKDLHHQFAITIFEQNDRVGKKLLATGNGRCNLTNLTATAADYSAPSFAAPALKAYPPAQVLDYFASLSLYTYEDAVGRVYPLSNQASSVLDALRLETDRLGISTRTNRLVSSVRQKNHRFLIDGQSYDFVVFACGGKANVKACNGLHLLKELGIPVTKTAPGLVKLTTSSLAAKQLKGVRAAVCLTLKNHGTVCASEEGELLFGDGVLSGIAAMNLSSTVNRTLANEPASFTVSVDFIPKMSFSELYETLQQIATTGQRPVCEHLLSGLLPKAIGLMLLRRAAIPAGKATTSLSAKELKALAALCKDCDFPITGTKSYPDAQIMLGGAALDAFSPQTLEAKTIRHLYCIGELLDVDAPCGGYNLQWAFSSALLCADSILQEVPHDTNQ